MTQTTNQLMEETDNKLINNLNNHQLHRLLFTWGFLINRFEQTETKLIHTNNSSSVDQSERWKTSYRFSITSENEGEWTASLSVSLSAFVQLVQWLSWKQLRLKQPADPESGCWWTALFQVKKEKTGQNWFLLFTFSFWESESSSSFWCCRGPRLSRHTDRPFGFSERFVLCRPPPPSLHN